MPQPIGPAIIRHDEIGGLPGGVCRMWTESNADVGQPDGGSVIDAVAGHRDDVAKHRA